MQKYILAFAITALVPCVYIAVANAGDYEEEYEEEAEVVETRGVAKRMSCDDIKKEMDELNALEELDNDQSDRLNTLKVDYRSKCMKKASGGRSVGRGSVARIKAQAVTVTKDVAEEKPAETEEAQEPNAACTNPDENGCCPGEIYTDLGDQGFNCCKEDDKNLCYPPIKVVKDYSLCDDGTEPDKNGCCAGEKYTDLGEQGFNCCKEDGKTCFPPIK